jgi:hypothetical protein
METAREARRMSAEEIRLVVMANLLFLMGQSKIY